MKMSVGLISISILISLFISACKTKVNFDEGDLTWLNVYKPGDSLIFRSSNGELDTSVILQKDVYNFDNPARSGRYIPRTGIVWYKNRSLINHPNGDRLVDVYKKHPDNSTVLVITYKYSSFFMLNIANGEMEKFRKGSVYELAVSGTQPSQPKTIFWDKTFGIIRYITRENIEWKRVNIPDMDK